MKLAIITGASSGIGLATAKQFSQQGFTVINIARRRASHPDIIDIPCDLSNSNALVSLAQQVTPYLKDVSEVAVVHNASQIVQDSADNCDAAILERLFFLNNVAPTMMNQWLIPLLPASSSLIYIGSTLSEKGVPQTYSYVTAKHATLGMMRATCQDLSGKGIHTACICPGFTDTEMVREHFAGNEALLNELGSNNGFKRMVRPDEIAKLIVWAHENPVINGAVLHANLGQNES